IRAPVRGATKEGRLGDVGGARGTRAARGADRSGVRRRRGARARIGVSRTGRGGRARRGARDRDRALPTWGPRGGRGFALLGGQVATRAAAPRSFGRAAGLDA